MKKLHFTGLCSLFVNQAYVKLVELADAKGGRLKIRTNFILDEFGNFSAIPNFGGFLTVGGGRGIRFNLFVQSFSQLNEKYR
ncbi:MAG: TraM recognition domain-containing protein [Clostridia bacterium]|nr:TraM recognition domain-containing protein [Clostridia bacterium]